MMNQPLTVAQLNAYVSQLLEQDTRLNPVLVKGELSGVKRYPSGHVYFTLKDREAAVSCVLFKGYASRLRFKPELGMNVIVTGRATLYTPRRSISAHCDGYDTRRTGCSVFGI